MDAKHTPGQQRITSAYTCNGSKTGKCEGERFGGCDYCDGTDRMGELFEQILQEQVVSERSE